MTKTSRMHIYLGMLPLWILSILIGAITAEAATYYVATTGSDSKSGTAVGTPFRSIQKCINTVAPGDTCTVANGNYTDTDGNGIVGHIRSPNANGTAGAPIRIKSTNALGAIITVPGINNGNAGFYVNRAYYIIEGFDIRGGTGAGASSANHGISVAPGGIGTLIRKNSIHHIARTLCYETTFGNTGVYIYDVSGVTIEDNRFYSIGRLRNGETGCSTAMYQHDHGIYVKGGANLMIRRNVIRDTNRGYPIHVYGGTVTNLKIYNNTLAGKSPTGRPTGQIRLASTINTAYVKNNISYNALVGMVSSYSLTASGIAVSFNLSNTQEKVNTWGGVTFSNNLQKTSPSFVNAAGYDYHLNPGSAALDAGTNVGLLFLGTAPDIGAYEF